jgi:hypothetical protein
MKENINKYFSDNKKLAILNSVLIAVLLFLNTIFQAFCIPTPWTILLLVICFANTIVYPLTENTFISPLTSFLSGVSFFIFTYCILFLAEFNLTGLLLIIFGIGLAVFIPHFLVLQLVWKNIIRPARTSSRYYFLAAAVICIAIIFKIRQDYKKALDSIENFKKSNYQTLDRSFMTEKILGMHFIYHTRFCQFDGWRPPEHEPILIIGMWLNNMHDPLDVNLETRLKLYKKFFPENKYKFDCSCALEYSEDYHEDNLWK